MGGGRTRVNINLRDKGHKDIYGSGDGSGSWGGGRK